MALSTADLRSRGLVSRLHYPLLRLGTPDWFAREVLLPFALTRLALTVVGLVASAGNWLAVWASWDAGWYLSIARDGYSQHAGEQSNTAFAPLLPLLMHLAAGLLGAPGDASVLLLSGVLISNAALLIALGYLVALVRLEADADTARRAALYVLVFPTTLFLSEVYPHALFLAAAIAAFYYARHGRWWLAGLVGALAGLARVQGALIVVPLALEYLAAHGYRPRRLRLDALGVPLAAGGGVALMLFLWVRVGDPLAPVHAQAMWARHFGPPWESLLAFLGQSFGAHGTDRSPLDLVFTLLLIALVALSWARVRHSLALFATLFLLVALSAGQLISTMRYGLELFPIFIALAISGRYRRFHYAYLGLAGLVALRMMDAFAQGAWVA